MNLKFSKIKQVNNPDRAHSTDAGIDFFMPKFNQNFINDLIIKNNSEHFSYNLDEKYIKLLKNSNICIPSGIKIEVPYGYAAIFQNKSGVSSKKELLVGACVIDTFYSGEVHIDLHNVSNEDVILKENDKLAQLVIFPILCCDIIEVEENELYKKMKKTAFRDEGGFGSTDKK